MQEWFSDPLSELVAEKLSEGFCLFDPTCSAFYLWVQRMRLGLRQESMACLQRMCRLMCNWTESHSAGHRVTLTAWNRLRHIEAAR